MFQQNVLLQSPCFEYEKNKDVRELVSFLFYPHRDRTHLILVQ